MAKQGPVFTKKSTKSGDRYYVSKRTKSGKLKQTAFTETYAPRGAGGLEIQIRYNTKLNPEGIKDFQPLARMIAVVAHHIRSRIRDRGMGYDNQPMGPAEISGGMWRSMKTSITARGKARAYFAGSSPATKRTNPSPRSKTPAGWKYKMRGKKKIMVLNKLKALNASGLGWVPPRDPKTGRMMPWDKKVRQQFASGKHKPISLFMMATREVQSAQSILALGMQAFAMTGEVDLSDWRALGDPKLTQELKRVLNL
tara:strand:- start:409 stop:1170 length:762 start_codon:yes stop_codon:yes gene_type:complete